MNLETLRAKFEQLKANVEQLIEKAQNSESGGEDDFIGIKYSNYDSYRKIPKTADARSLDKMLQIDNNENTDQNHALTYTFANTTKSGNGGYFALLEEVYLPSKMTVLNYTFQYCTKLITIHGDLSTVVDLYSAFIYCTNLDINALLARMTALTTIGNGSFRDCTQATEITFPATVTSIHSGAFGGCTNVTDVHCPWAEGTVANSPWGMTNATIHYNSEV